MKKKILLISSICSLFLFSSCKQIVVEINTMKPTNNEKNDLIDDEECEDLDYCN